MTTARGAISLTHFNSLSTLSKLRSPFTKTMENLALHHSRFVGKSQFQQRTALGPRNQPEANDTALHEMDCWF